MTIMCSRLAMFAIGSGSWINVAGVPVALKRGS